MIRLAGKAPQASVPTPERAAEVEKFFTTLRLIQDAFHLEVRGDGLEIHDRQTGTYPAIITEDGALEILNGAQHAIVDSDRPEAESVN
jgi:hypothetical protein